MTVPGYPAAEVLAALDWTQAVEALRAALLGGLDPEAEPSRVSFPFGAGELLAMPSSGPRRAGVKLVGIAPDNPSRGLPRIHGVYLLFDAQTLEPLATLDGAALTVLRTPAVSALGVDLVAPARASSLVVFGSGPQARAHVAALRAVRPVSAVRVVGRHPGRAAALVAQLREQGVDAATADPRVVADADLVVCATTARTPLFDGRRLAAGAVVVAVGSHEPEAREVDAETARRGGVLVEARAVAGTEAGDVRLARAEGAIGAADVVTFAELVKRPAAAATRRPWLVKTVGMGWEDLVVAGAVFDAVQAGRTGAAP